MEIDNILDFVYKNWLDLMVIWFIALTMLCLILRYRTLPDEE